VWLDWEDEQRDDPGSYAGAAGPSLVTVLDAFQRAVVAALGRDGRAVERARQAFGEYRQGAARMPEYAARFADVVAQSRQPGSQFTSQDAAALAKTAASAGLVVIGHPGGVLGLSPDQLGAAAQAGGHLSEAAIRAVTRKKPGEISPEEYDLVTDPARELTRRAAAAVHTIAGLGPLLVLLDTGEVIGDRAWSWLRRVMTHTGSRVAWVVGARFETEAEAGADSPVAQFVRDIGDEHLVLMSPTRFDDAMIRAYLESRPSARSYSNEEIGAIARFTGGLPLAVSLTATLLDEGQPVEIVCREVEHGHPSSVVSQMARRYLVHAESRAYPADDPRRDDLAKILGLALAFEDLRNDPELLATLWDIQDPLDAFQDLARRHDFVLPTSRRLHQDVRSTLLTDLVDPYRRARTREINQRALTLMLTRLARMRQRWPTVDEQLDHTRFTTALLAALWHTLWADNQAGLDLFVDVLPILATADLPTADAAAAIMDQLAGTFDQDQRRDLDLLTYVHDVWPRAFPRNWPSDPGGAATDMVRRAEITLPGLALHPPNPAAEDRLIGGPGDRQVSVMILRAGLLARDNDEAAVATLRTAATQTSSTRLRQVIGAQAGHIANRLIFARSGFAGPGAYAVPSATGLAAAEIAAEMLTDNAMAWNTYGAALKEAGRLEEALAVFDQALVLDPANAIAHSNRGAALVSLGRSEEALAACDQALALDPANARAHGNRGAALVSLGRSEEALAACDQALALNPDDARAHAARGATLVNLGRSEEALAACDQGLTLYPDDAPLHAARGAVLVSLGRFEEALAACDQGLTFDPANAPLHAARGMVLGSLGRFEEALAACDQGLTLDPANAVLHATRGAMLGGLGRFEEALAACDQGLTLGPANARAHATRGEALVSLGRFEEALAACDLGLTLGPYDAVLHATRGEALVGLGRLEEALAAYDQALALDPDNAVLHATRGEALVGLGRLEEALAAYDQTLALDPDNAGVHDNRGYTLLGLGRFEEALVACEQALALDPDDATAHENEGIVLAAIGDLDQALAQFDAADRLAPDGVGEGRTWAGAILWHRRDQARARDRFALVKGRVTGCTPFRTAEMEAIALCGLGRPDDAKEHLLDALSLRGPEHEPTPRIYDLLSDPPLPGIDRLHAIVENDS
jgi:tetratricopeptide (TPR) repeat protein